MKFSHYRPVPSRRSGFTLVELLVVMGIIAILATAVLTTGSSVINSAKRAKAASNATQIQTAVLAYYTEYSIYPNLTSPTAPTTDIYVSTQANWYVMSVVLSGGFDPGNPIAGQVTAAPYNQNTRQIPFLNFNKADLDSSGTYSVPKLPFKDLSNNTLYFQMAIDTDYSGIVGDTGTGTAPPDFTGTTLSGTTSTAYASGNITGNTKAVQGGVAVWGCGDPNTKTTTNPKLWVKTF